MLTNPEFKIQRLTPTGLPMEEPEESDNDLRRTIQASQLKGRRIRLPTTIRPLSIPYADQEEAFRRPRRRR